MKGLGIFLVLIAIVAGIIFLGKSKDSQVLPEEVTNTNQDEMVSPSETNENLDGQKDFDIEKSTANWSGSKKIIKDWTDRGTIKIKQGFVTFSKGELTGGEVVFDMTTITATSTGKGDGEDKLSSHLKSDDFFGVETYPEAKFVITSSAKESGGTYLVTGDLTIKGKTSSESFPLEVKDENNQITLIGGTNIDRTVYDVKFGSDKFFQDLGDNVINDEFSIEFTVVTK